MAAKRGRSQKNNNVKPTSLTIPAAVQTRFQPKQQTTATRVKGCDNLALVSTITGGLYAPGAEIVSGGITAHSSVRLATLANAFQRIRWHSIRFTIEGAYPTLAGGGYVACFVRDATDVPPSDPTEAIRWAMAQQHSFDAKWYDSGVLNVGVSPDLLYTSSAEAVRLYSPGSFYVISKGGPAQVGTLTVNFHWDVTLSEPTSEVQVAQQETWTTPFDLVLPFNPTAYLSLSRVTTFNVDPHSATYEVQSPEQLGLNQYGDGTYFRLPRPITATGAYNTGNDYIPINVDGFTIANGQVVAVSEFGGEFVILIPDGGGSAVPSGYTASDWHLLSGGYGSCLPIQTVLKVYPTPGASVPVIPTRRRFFHYKDKYLLGDINYQVAQVNLSGEA